MIKTKTKRANIDIMYSEIMSVEKEEKSSKISYQNMIQNETEHHIKKKKNFVSLQRLIQKKRKIEL